ncbi:hypothetical protein, partial [Litorimonas sp.]|uniref:hypothetical protein n=1 Tax=Litorimonas sp. TaxID=1892381 RepID=UPI003A83D95C
CTVLLAELTGRGFDWLVDEVIRTGIGSARSPRGELHQTPDTAIQHCTESDVFMTSGLNNRPEVAL